MGRHPMGEGVDPNPRIVSEKLVDPDALVMGKTAENLHDRFPHAHQGARRRLRRRQPGQARRGLRRRQDPARPGAGRHPARRAGLGPGHRRRAAAPRHHASRTSAALKTPFRAARQGHRRQRRRPQRRRHRVPPRLARQAAERARPAGRMRLVVFAFVGVEPEVMGIGPVPATEKALRQGRPDHRRHRPVRAQRGVRRAGARLPRALRHRRRRPARQPVRRRHRHRPPARLLRRAPDDPARRASSRSTPRCATA